MPAKKGPMFLILLLVLTLVLVLGIRYGQHIELQNKKNLAILSLTPSRNPSPSSIKISFKTYSNKSCGLSFLYPSSITLAKESTDEARFTQAGSQVAITMSCKKDVKLPSGIQKVTTSEAQFQKKNIKVQSYIVNGSPLFFMPVTNPSTSKVVYFLLDKNLFPLLEKSLSFN